MFRRLLSIVSITTLIASLVVNQAFASDDISFTVQRTVAPAGGQVMAGEDITIKYKIQPDDVAAGEVKPAEIAIVIDTSGSMRTDDGTGRRIDAAKEAARKFIERFKDNPNVKISIIEYDYSAEDLTGLLKADNPALLTAVNGLTHGGYTNIGDGVRIAMHQLINGETGVNKFMIFMTDGYANRSTKKDSNGHYYYGSDAYNNDDYYLSNSGGVTYAQRVTQRMEVGSNQNPSTYIKPYFIAFSNNASTLKSIAYYDSDESRPRVTGLAYEAVGTGDALIQYYDDIASEIEDAISLDLKFQESFFGEVNVDEILSSDLVGITTADIEVKNVDGVTKVVSKGDGWPINYVLNEKTGIYKADAIELTLRVSANEAGLFTFGGGGSSYVKFIKPDGTVEIIDFPADNFEAYAVNPPMINMSQEEDSLARTFTLDYMGLGNMHFGGNDTGQRQYVDFETSWSDNFFGPSNDEWTIKAVLMPKDLDGEKTNHEVSNVYLAKASDPYNDNIELGIDPTTNNLLIYLDTDDVDKDAISVGNGELTENIQHDVVVTYDNGSLQVSLDGHVYDVADYIGSNNHMDGAVGSDFTIGGSLHYDTFFSGTINEVSLYDHAYSAKELYKKAPGTENPYASWQAGQSTEDQLKDQSGNGRHSTSLNGTFIQEDLNPDDVKLYYQLDSNGWIEYNDGDVIEALTLPGSVTVYAKAVYKGIYESKVIEKQASMADNRYINSISLQSDKYDMVENENFVMTYTFKGDALIISGQSAPSIYLKPVDVVLAYPSTVNVLGIDHSELSDDDINHQVVGTFNNLEMVRQADGTYKLEEFQVKVTAEPVGWNNIEYPSNTASISYEDFFGHTVNFSDGIAQDITVRPVGPTISEIGIGDKIYQYMISDVAISGETSYTWDVYMKVQGKKSDGNGIADDDNVSPISPVNGNGKYDYSVDAIDMTLFSPNYSVEALATVTDPEGDASTSTRQFWVEILDLGVDLK